MLIDLNCIEDTDSANLNFLYLATSRVEQISAMRENFKEYEILTAMDVNIVVF